MRARPESNGEHLFSPSVAAPLPWERDPLDDELWAPEYAIHDRDGLRHICSTATAEQRASLLEGWRRAAPEDEVFAFWRDLTLNFGVVLTPAARAELRRTLKAYGDVAPILRAVVGARRDEWLAARAPADFARVIATAQKTRAGIIDNVARYGASIGAEELGDALLDAATNHINWMAWSADRLDVIDPEFVREHRKLLQRDDPGRYRRWGERRAEALAAPEHDR